MVAHFEYVLMGIRVNGRCCRPVLPGAVRERRRWSRPGRVVCENHGSLRHAWIQPFKSRRGSSVRKWRCSRDQANAANVLGVAGALYGDVWPPEFIQMGSESVIAPLGSIVVQDDDPDDWL